MAPQPQGTNAPNSSPTTGGTPGPASDATEALIPFSAATGGLYTLHVPLSPDANASATAVLQGPGLNSSIGYLVPAVSQTIASPTPVSVVTITGASDTYTLALHTNGNLTAQVNDTNGQHYFQLDQVAGTQASGAPVGALAALGAIAGLGLVASGIFAYLFFRRRTTQKAQTKLYTPAESNTHYSDKLQADNAALQQRIQTLEKDNLRFAAQSPSTLNDVSTFSSSISILNGALEQVYGHGGPAAGMLLTSILYREVFSRVLMGIDDTVLAHIYRNMPDPTSALTWRAQTARVYYSTLPEQDLQAFKSRLVNSAKSEIIPVSKRASASVDKYISRSIDLAVDAGKAIASEAGAYEVLYAPAGTAYDPATMAPLDGFSAIKGTRAFGLRFGGHVALKLRASP